MRLCTKHSIQETMSCFFFKILTFKYHSSLQCVPFVFYLLSLSNWSQYSEVNTAQKWDRVLFYQPCIGFASSRPEHLLFFLSTHRNWSLPLMFSCFKLRMIGPRSLKDMIVLRWLIDAEKSGCSRISHLVVCEVIPMLGAIEVFLVCFLNNATLSINVKAKSAILLYLTQCNSQHMKR